MFRSALLILSGNTAFFLLILIRNLVIARLISVEDYGVAATFAISMAIVEMMSDLGLQQLIIQDRDGNDPELQSALQGFHLLRACVGAFVLFFMAHPIARFLNIPDIAWAYQLLALVPLANGFLHFDIHRKNRKMVYLPVVLTKTLPAVVSLLLVWPFFLYYGDYRVMLFAILAQILLTVFTSHLVAERAYRLRLDWSVTQRAFRFGWPLLANGVLLFLVFHGEKVIIGRELGMAALAIFAMGFTLTLRPTLVMTSSAQSFFLPQLSAAKDDRDLFGHLAMTTLQTSLISGAVLVVATVLLGAPFVQLVLGDKYAELIPLLEWLAILQAVRAFKTGGAVAAVAQAKTGNAMIANLFRVASMPVSWYVAVTSGDIFMVVTVAMIGECCGYLASLLLLRFRLGLTLAPMTLPILITACLLIFTGLKNWVMQFAFFADNWLVFYALLIGMFILALASMRDLRKYIQRRVALSHSD